MKSRPTFLVSMMVVLISADSPLASQSNEAPASVMERICTFESHGDPSWRLDQWVPPGGITQGSLIIDYDYDSVMVIKSFAVHLESIRKNLVSFIVEYQLCAKTTGEGENRTFIICNDQVKVPVTLKLKTGKWSVVGAFPIAILPDSLNERLAEVIQKYQRYIPDMEQEKSPRGEFFRRIQKEIQFVKRLTNAVNNPK